MSNGLLYSNNLESKGKLLHLLHFLQHLSDEKKEAIALSMRDHQVTYLELQELVNAYAYHLQKEGVGKNERVALCLERGISQIAWLLAILKCGAAYIPIDPEYPEDRIRYMTEKSQARLVILNNKFKNKFRNTKILCVEEALIEKDRQAAFNYEDNQVIYLIFTSGSTGNPKAVEMNGKSLSALIDWQIKELSTNKNTVLQYTPISFDVHFQEIFFALNTYSELVLISEMDRLDPKKLISTIEQKNVTHLFFPYVALSSFCYACQKLKVYPQSLVHITTAGEALKITQTIRETFKELKATLHNHYGPSETHVVTAYSLDKNVDSWNELPAIGKALPSANVYLLNEELNEQVHEGEAYFGGDCLANGYYNDPELTKERFIESKKYGRLYKTGDILRLDEKGNFFFVRRNDAQVKVRGYRIELKEVEAQIENIKEIELCACKVFDKKGTNVLCAFYVGNKDERVLKEILKEKMPEYMVPTHFIKMEKLELTPSGKVDYKKLNFDFPKEMETPVKNTQSIYELIKTSWEKELSLSLFDEENVFDKGATSLNAMNVLLEINEKEELTTIMDIFQYPTIQSLVNKIVKVEKRESRKHSSSEELHDIAIVGMSARIGGESDLELIWNKILKGENFLGKFDLFEADPYIPTKTLVDKNFVNVKAEFENSKEFDNELFGILPKYAKLMDPQQRKFLEVCYEALEHAGYKLEKENRTGVFAGGGVSKYERVIIENGDLINPENEFNVMLGLEKDFLALRIAHKLNLKGPALTTITACSSSLVSIIQAVDNLRLNKCDMALAGGAAMSGLYHAGHTYQEGGILSKDGICRPFDQEASGTIFSDGAGVVVLKRLSDAQRDNDTIYAVIKGVGINNDGGEKASFMAPSIEGQKKAIEMALEDAKVDVNEICYIEAHGTATPIGDPIEFEALKEALREKTTKAYLGSIKANTGHLTAAAGVAGLIKAVLSLNHKIIPPLANFNRVNEFLKIEKSQFEINTEAIALKDEKVLMGISSFGVGGTNAHIVIASYNEKMAKQYDELPAVLKLSAPTKEQLQQLVQEVKEEHYSNYESVSFTLDKGRERYPFKAAIVREGKEDYLFNPSSQHKKLKNVLLFSGQGAFYEKMGMQLYVTNEDFRKIIDEGFALFKEETDLSLKEILFGENSGQYLKETFYAQPCIFLFQYATAKVFIDNGLKADVLIGHSVGEYVAAALAEALAFKDALRLLIKRAQLISKLTPAKMLVVSSTKEEIKKYLKEDQEISCFNTPKSLVIGSSIEKIDLLKKRLNDNSIAFLELATSHAFHTSLVDPILNEFAVLVEKVEFKKPKIKMISSVRPNIEIFDGKYFVNQLREAVNFNEAIRTQIDQDVVFIDFSPKGVLNSFVKSHYKETNSQWELVNIHQSVVEKELLSVTKSLAGLWCLGVDVSLDSFITRENHRRVPAPLYKFRKNKYWIEYNNKSGDFMNKQDILNELKELFEDASGLDLNPENHGHSFLDLGLDSLFFTQFAIDVKKKFKVEITFREIMEKYNSIKVLQDHLAKTLNVVDEVVLESKTFAPEIKAAVATTREVELPKMAPMPPAPMLNQVLAPVANQVKTQYASSVVASNNLEAIILKQMDLMQQHLMMLSGQAVSMAPTQINSPASAQNIDIPLPAPAHGVMPKEKEEIKSKAKLNNLKDAFGAQARINSEKTNELKVLETKKVQDFFNEYIKKTSSSKKFTQENRINHADPRAVTGFKPEVKEIVYPIVVKKSYMQKLWDLDGNEYLDMTCGFGSNFFGNGNDRIKKYVLKQIEEGIELGPQHPLVSEVSKLVNELTGNERTAFCNTGSEAVLGAMRIARTTSGKDKIIAFSGSYHGINDEVIVRAAKNKTVPAAPGINKESVSNMIILDYGTEESLEIIKQMASEIAAVLVEPVQSRRSDFHPKEFLKEVRKITEENNVCLIFDEIITGFRVHPAGAQGYFGIRADLCTYGKIVGGGMPIGMISGKAKFMDALDGGFWQYGDESVPTVGVTYFAGTFVRHPLALAAAKGSLEILKEGGVNLLSDLSNRAQLFVDEVNKFLKIENAPIQLDNFGSLMKPKWKRDVSGGEVLFALLRYNGLHVYDGFPWFVNLAHTQRDLDFALDVIKKSVLEMQRLGLFVTEKKVQDLATDLIDEALLDSDVFDKKGAPMPGARIGKDEHGNPAWFVEDATNLGQYFILKKIETK